MACPLDSVDVTRDSTTHVRPEGSSSSFHRRSSVARIIKRSSIAILPYQARTPYFSTPATLRSLFCFTSATTSTNQGSIRTCEFHSLRSVSLLLTVFYSAVLIASCKLFLPLRRKISLQAIPTSPSLPQNQEFLLLPI